MRWKVFRVCALGGMVLTLSACLVTGQTNGSRGPGTKDSITLVTPGPAGEVRILSRETTTAEKAEPKGAPKEATTNSEPRKARVVVVPAVYAQSERSRFEREITEKWNLSPDIIENPGYASYLVDALVNCRKFDVLERENLKSVTKELDFGESGYADLSKVARLGQMLNADYVVIPEIRHITFVVEQKAVPYVGKDQIKYVAKLGRTIRTVNIRTSRIASSDVGESEIKGGMDKKDGAWVLTIGSAIGPFGDVLGKLYAESSAQAAANIIDAAYPLRVLAVADKTCVLNRGRGTIKEGELLDVYKRGEVMVDPDTKENLGYHEARAGQVKVVQVDERTSTAEIVEGAGAIAKLDVCRRVRKAEQPAPQLPAPKID